MIDKHLQFPTWFRKDAEEGDVVLEAWYTVYDNVLYRAHLHWGRYDHRIEVFAWTEGVWTNRLYEAHKTSTLTIAHRDHPVTVQELHDRLQLWRERLPAYLAERVL